MPPPTTRRHPPPVAALALALAVATVAAACTHPHQQLGPTAKVTAPARPTPESSSPTVEQQVAAAYVAGQATYFHNALNPDPADPQLTAMLSGPQLLRTVSLLREARSKRVVARLRAGRQPKVEVETLSLVNATAAHLQACTTDDVIRVQVPGERVIDNSVASYRTRAELRLEAGRWKTVDERTLQSWADLRGCAR